MSNTMDYKEVVLVQEDKSKLIEALKNELNVKDEVLKTLKRYQRRGSN